MRSLKYVLPSAGLIAILVLAAFEATVEVLIYAVLAELCIFVVTDPYRIIHYWLSTPARAIIVTIIVVDTVVIRTHLSTEYVVIPAVLSTIAFLAILRFNTDWKAHRAYTESVTVSEAMSLNEETAAWKSWIFHGKSEVEEMVYRFCRYTGRQAFSQQDAVIWKNEHERIESREPVANLTQSISVDRMKDFLGMVYRLGYLRSAPYRAETAKCKKEIAEIEQILQEKDTEIEELKKQEIELKNELQEEIDCLKNDLIKREAENDSLFEISKNNYNAAIELEKERNQLYADLQRATRLAEQFEKKAEELQKQMQILKQENSKKIEDIDIKESPEHQVQITTKSANTQIPGKAKLQRMTEADKEKIYELRKNHTVEEVSKITGWSEKSVKRATAELKEKAAVN